MLVWNHTGSSGKIQNAGCTLRFYNVVFGKYVALSHPAETNRMQHLPFIVFALLLSCRNSCYTFLCGPGAAADTCSRERETNHPGGATSGTVTGSLWVPSTLASPFLIAEIAIKCLILSKCRVSLSSDWYYSVSNGGPPPTASPRWASCCE